MKSAGKARSNGLYRHIRTSKEIIRNLLNYFSNRKSAASHSCAAKQQRNTMRKLQLQRETGAFYDQVFALLFESAIVLSVLYHLQKTPYESAHPGRVPGGRRRPSGFCILHRRSALPQPRALPRRSPQMRYTAHG